MMDGEDQQQTPLDREYTGKIFYSKDGATKMTNGQVKRYSVKDLLEIRKRLPVVIDASFNDIMDSCLKRPRKNYVPPGNASGNGRTRQQHQQQQRNYNKNFNRNEEAVPSWFGSGDDKLDNKSDFDFSGRKLEPFNMEDFKKELKFKETSAVEEKKMEMSLIDKLVFEMPVENENETVTIEKRSEKSTTKSRFGSRFFRLDEKKTEEEIKIRVEKPVEQVPNPKSAAVPIDHLLSLLNTSTASTSSNPNIPINVLRRMSSEKTQPVMSSNPEIDILAQLRTQSHMPASPQPVSPTIREFYNPMRPPLQPRPPIPTGVHAQFYMGPPPSYTAGPNIPPSFSPPNLHPVPPPNYFNDYPRPKSQEIPSAFNNLVEMQARMNAMNNFNNMRQPAGIPFTRPVPFNQGLSQSQAVIPPTNIPFAENVNMEQKMLAQRIKQNQVEQEKITHQQMQHIQQLLNVRQDNNPSTNDAARELLKSLIMKPSQEQEVTQGPAEEPKDNPLEKWFGKADSTTSSNNTANPKKNRRKLRAQGNERDSKSGKK